MNSNEIFAAIEHIAATPGKNDKATLLAAHMQDEQFRRCCEYAYNPFKTYGIKDIPGIEDIPEHESDGAIFFPEVWAMLDAMIARTLTGDAARDTLQRTLSLLSPESAELLKRIIRKNMRAGFSESSCNKAWKGLVPEFSYMRCSLPKDTDLAKWPWADGVFSQEKADGMFANVDHEDDGRVAIRSRQGTEFPVEKFPEVVADVQARLLRGRQHHGEFVVERDGVILDREIGNGIMNSVINGEGDFAPNERPVFLVWDQIPLSAAVPKGKHAAPYRTRFIGVVQQLRDTPGTAVRLIPTRVVRSLKEAYMHCRELLLQGKEGTVIKHPGGGWADGTSKHQIKLKLEFNVDLEITAIVPGRAGTKNEGRPGSVTAQTCDGLLITDVTIKNEAMRNAIEKNPEEFIGKIMPITANDITKPTEDKPIPSLYLPRMAEANYRTDKSVADSYQRVQEILEAALNAGVDVGLEKAA